MGRTAALVCCDSCSGASPIRGGTLFIVLPHGGHLHHFFKLPYSNAHVAVRPDNYPCTFYLCGTCTIPFYLSRTFWDRQAVKVSLGSLSFLFCLKSKVTARKIHKKFCEYMSVLAEIRVPDEISKLVVSFFFSYGQICDECRNSGVQVL